MILNNRTKVTKIFSGQSKFSFWNDIQKNDILNISIKLKLTGRSASGGVKSTFINIYNERTGEVFECRFNLMIKYLNKLEFIEL